MKQLLILFFVLMALPLRAQEPAVDEHNKPLYQDLIPETLLEKVQKGDGEVAYFIGNLFKQGVDNEYQTIPQDEQAAQLWFEKSAELGYAHGMYETGLMLYRDKKWPAAKKWLQQAADVGIGDAFYRLAYFHVYGVGGETVDCQKAYELFSEAKIRGVRYAYNDWAWMLTTQPDKKCRNGHQALKIMAELESEFGRQRMPWSMIDTKAAVLAEIADFNGAIELQSWVVAGYCGITVSEIDDFSQLLKDYRQRSEEDKVKGCDGFVERLQVYSQRQVWREEMVLKDDE
ncbi:MAG: tetratricopeptide repeat protein [Marinicella pacifica]